MNRIILKQSSLDSVLKRPVGAGILYLPTNQRLKLFFSLIVMKNSPTVPLGFWSSNRLAFFRYLFSLLKYGIFTIFVFFNSVRLFYEQTLSILFNFIAKTPLNSKPLEFL